MPVDERPAVGRTLDGLIAALQTLAEQTETLASDVRADAAQRREEDRRRRKATIAALVVGVLLVLLTGLVLYVGRQNNRIGNQIADCTTAGGRCYEEGRRRSGSNLELLIRAQVYAQSCREQPGVDTDDEVFACVKAKLAATPSPSP